MKIKMFFFLGLISISLSFGQNKYDGYWWNNLNDDEKLFLVIGMFQGMELGNFVTFLKYNKDDREKYDNIYNAAKEKYFGVGKIDYSNQQVVDGIDKFYSDYKHRNINIRNALFVVGLELTDAPQKDIDMVLKIFRGTQ